jgi:putative glutamine amidotransferase
MNERAPLIAITPESEFLPEDARTRGSVKLNYNYSEEVAKAGGVPIIVPPTADPNAIAAIIDGWLIPGGMDIHSRWWGEELHPDAKPNDDSRVESEMRLYQAIDPHLPILGICYGCQFLNVAAGGTLEQHLPDRLHHNHHSEGTLEPVRVDLDSELGKIVGSEQVEGKSYHHQAISNLGAGLVVSGTHSDGTIEAIESTGERWLIGVQWHPERTSSSHESSAIFTEFIAAARKYAASKGRNSCATS